jgi:hypothetical protein
MAESAPVADVTVEEMHGTKPAKVGDERAERFVVRLSIHVDREARFLGV